MTKINTTGGFTPPFTNSSENVKPQTVTTKETNPTIPSSPKVESAVPKDATGDKPVTGDLKVQGEQVKSQLNSKLETQSFAPPLVPVGPVVTKENITKPGESVATTPGESVAPSKTKNLLLKN
jgi:hypothetical protein